MKVGAHVYCTTIYSTNQQLQVCKQQQTASGNKKYVIYVCAYNSSILRPITMTFGTRVYCTMTYSTNQQLQVCKQQTTSGNKHL